MSGAWTKGPIEPPSSVRSDYTELRLGKGKIVGYVCCECGHLYDHLHKPKCVLGEVAALAKARGEI